MPENVRVAKVRFVPSGFYVWAAGDELEYLVSTDPPMCTCPDFSFHLARGSPSPCKHLRSVLASEYWGIYEEITLPDERLVEVLAGSSPLRGRTA